MEWYYILLIVIAGLLVLAFIFILIVSFLVAQKIAEPKRYTRTEQNDFNKKSGFDLGTEVLERKPITFKMSDGYVINGDYSLVKGSKKFCILAHGHSTTREGAVRYSLVFHDLGFSTIIYDERSHGDNVHKTVTMGKQESKDLAEIINLVYEKFGKDIYLGLQGVSMGAATVLMSTKYTQNVKFIVSDCAYANIKNVMSDMIEHFHLPSKIFLPFVNMFLKANYHYSFDDCRPIICMEANKIPILFIHGDADAFVDVENAYELDKATKAKHELVIFKGATHANSLTINRDLYISSIKSFLKEIE